MIFTPKDKKSTSAVILLLFSALAILTVDEELNDIRDSITRRNLTELDADGTTSLVLRIIGKGMLVGGLYVLNAPNLATVATLSGTDVGEDWDEGIERTFSIGVRWGIANSIGILVTIALFTCLSMKGHEVWIYLHNDAITTALQANVGVFLLLTGVYGVLKSIKNRVCASDDSISENSAITPVAGNISRKKLETIEEGSVTSGYGSIADSIVNKMVECLVADKKSKENEEESTGSIASGNGSVDDSIVNKMVHCLSADKKSKENEEESTGSVASGYGYIADSIVNKIVKYLDTDKKSKENEEDSECLYSHKDPEIQPATSEFERKMWKAVMTLTEIMKEDEENFLTCFNRSIALGESIVTVNMDHLEYDEDDIALRRDTDTIDSMGDAFEDKVIKMPEGMDMPEDPSVEPPELRFLSLCRISPGVLAVFAGLISGIAAPGTIIGDIKSWPTSHQILYFSTLTLVSTLVMSGLAALYGKLCKWLAGNPDDKDEDAILRRVFLIEFGSACLSIIVGVVWLVILGVEHVDVMFIFDTILSKSAVLPGNL